MSVLTCPVCQGAMREINKGGVLIDTCSQCRGVWLDRGELEKLSAMVGEVPPAAPGFLGGMVQPQPHLQPQQQYQTRRDRDDDDDDDDRRYRRDGGYAKHKKSKVARLLDFFD